MEVARDRVGMLCDQLGRFPDLHHIIRDACADKELDKLLAALGGVGELDQDRMLAWLQAIEDACARKGRGIQRVPILDCAVITGPSRIGLPRSRRIVRPFQPPESFLERRPGPLKPARGPDLCVEPREVAIHPQGVDQEVRDDTSSYAR